MALYRVERIHGLGHSGNRMSVNTGIHQIGNSDVYVLPNQQYVGNITPPSLCARIRMPVPPSSNNWLKTGVRQFSNGGRTGMYFKPTPIMRLSDEARAFYGNALPLRMAWKMVKENPFTDFVKIKFFFFLKNMRYDAHNGLKLACDLIEKSGLVVNDNFILPEIMLPISAKDDPRLLIEFPLD